MDQFRLGEDESEALFQSERVARRQERLHPPAVVQTLTVQQKWDLARMFVPAALGLGGYVIGRTHSQFVADGHETPKPRPIKEGPLFGPPEEPEYLVRERERERVRRLKDPVPPPRNSPLFGPDTEPAYMRNERIVRATESNEKEDKEEMTKAGA